MHMQGGSGSASNIQFQNIQMDNVANPIIIDQNYCDQETPCEEQVINQINSLGKCRSNFFATVFFHAFM